MTKVFLIVADKADGTRFECFHWSRQPEAGIARAKRDAIAFGFTDLTNFRAEEISA